ncbi:MAG: hypothetical protein AB6733_08735 [Clostridiaceae bacterium]
MNNLDENKFNVSMEHVVLTPEDIKRLKSFGQSTFGCLHVIFVFMAFVGLILAIAGSFILKNLRYVLTCASVSVVFLLLIVVNSMLSKKVDKDISNGIKYILTGNLEHKIKPSRGPARYRLNGKMYNVAYEFYDRADKGDKIELHICPLTNYVCNVVNIEKS